MGKFLRLFYTSYVVFFVYSILNLSFGISGFSEFTKLQKYREDLVLNIQHLRNNNDDLADELEILKSSPEVLKLKARELGYYGRDEKIVRTVGFQTKKSFYSVGKMMKYTYLEDNRRPLFRAVSILCGALFYLVFFVLRKKRL